MFNIVQNAGIFLGVTPLACAVQGTLPQDKAHHLQQRTVHKRKKVFIEKAIHKPILHEIIHVE